MAITPDLSQISRKQSELADHIFTLNIEGKAWIPFAVKSQAIGIYTDILIDNLLALPNSIVVGKEVFKFEIEGDDLYVFYTDGTTTNLGRVVGEQGIPGEDGVGIELLEIIDLDLYVTYTTGATVNLGQIVGDNGWTPTPAIATDGARRVIQVIDWVGGTGTKPTTGLYVGATGLVANIADAVDVRGPQGTAGTNGTNGTNGTDGKTVRSGSGAPSGGLGVDGDFYIDTTANTIYGPKTAGAWGSPTSIVGPTGATGPAGPAFAYSQLANTYEFFDHFDYFALDAQLYRSSVSGTGAVASQLRTDTIGVFRFSVSTTNTSQAAILMPSQASVFNVPALGVYSLQTAVLFNNLPVVGGQWLWRSMLLNTTAVPGQQIGVGIRLVWSVSAVAPVFQCFAFNGTTETTITSGITPATATWYAFAFTITNRTSVQFWINGVSQGTISTNIPNVTLQIFLALNNNSSNTSAVSVDLDALQYKYVRPASLSWLSL